MEAYKPTVWVCTPLPVVPKDHKMISPDQKLLHLVFDWR